MKNILILEGSSDLLKSIKSVFKKYESKITLLIASDSSEAICFLKEKPISVLVADLFMLEIDDLELLTYMSRHHSKIPCIMTAAYRSPKVNKILSQMGIFHFLEKPFAAEDLLKVIAVAFKSLSKGEAISRLSTVGFLEYLQEENKSCILEIITQGGERGVLYLVDGNMVEAKYGNLQGEEAAVAILGLGRVAFDLKASPATDLKASINSSLKELVAKVPVAKSGIKEKKIVETANENLPEMFSRAIRSAELGDMKSAQQTLAEILKINPKSNKAWLWFARTANDINTINISLTKALAILPEDAEVNEDILKLKSAIQAGCREDGKLDHCFFCWSPILKNQAICHYCYARVDMDEDFFQSIFFGSPKEPDLQLIEETLQRISRASKLDPQNVKGHFLLAMAHVNMNNWVDALRELKEAESIDPNHSYKEQLAIMSDFVEDLNSFELDS